MYQIAVQEGGGWGASLSRIPALSLIRYPPGFARGGEGGTILP